MGILYGITNINNLNRKICMHFRDVNVFRKIPCLLRSAAYRYNSLWFAHCQWMQMCNWIKNSGVNICRGITLVNGSVFEYDEKLPSNCRRLKMSSNLWNFLMDSIKKWYAFNTVLYIKYRQTCSSTTYEFQIEWVIFRVQIFTFIVMSTVSFLLNTEFRFFSFDGMHIRYNFSVSNGKHTRLI